MKKNCILLLFIVVLWACKVNKEANLEADTAIQDSLKKTTTISKSFYYEPLGDTIYVDYDIEFRDAPEPKEDVKLERYFIITSFDSYQNDEEFQDELKRWRELEPSSYQETYGNDKAKKYFISLGKYKTRAELLPVWQEFKKKYPTENINFFSIRQ